MEHLIDIRNQLNTLRVRKIPMYVIIVSFVFSLSVLQDYIYSNLQQTGFYLSESLLYNTFWILFVPFTAVVSRLTKRINPENNWKKLPYTIGVGIAFAFIHIVLFTALFVLISNLVYTPPHRFSRIFNTALSNQLYITIFWYSLFPLIYMAKGKTAKVAAGYAQKIKVKQGSKITTISTATIQLITTDTPYAVIYSENQKFLESKSLKEFETKLDPSVFIRVHRSAIVNCSFVKELKSRSNGDYDATLQNQKIIRFSRHYRKKWQHLLQ